MLIFSSSKIVIVLFLSFYAGKYYKYVLLSLTGLLNDDQVLWPECGWNPVSLTDMITAPSVKKAYRKATLCIHPDKVQQKGANLQQKYIAEKVFDLLKVHSQLRYDWRNYTFYPFSFNLSCCYKMHCINKLSP